MYFITICTCDRKCLFGHVVGAGPSAGPKMVLNEIGSIVESVWREIPIHYPNVQIDAFVMMPNHIHGIIELTNGEFNSTDVGAGSPRPSGKQGAETAPTTSDIG